MDSLIPAALLAIGVVLAAIAVTARDPILFAVGITSVALGMRELLALLRADESGEKV